MSKEEILKVYLSYVIKHKKHPTRNELLTFGEVSRDIVRSRFGNYENLRKQIIEDGAVDDYIFDVESLDAKYVKATNKELGKYKRFVITTAVANSNVNKEFFASLKGYCEHEKAALIILPSLMNKSGPKWNLDVSLKDEHVLFYDYHFNDNVAVLGMVNNSKSSDPVSGLPRLGKRNGSFICSSPKQNLKVVPTGANKLPHCIMSTGAVTYPEYRTPGPMRARQDYLAENDHVMGAIVVELDIDNTFHFRQIQADKDNGFADLGNYYKANKKSFYAPAAFVMGDWHSGETDEGVACAWFNICHNLNVKELIIHDGFNGLSVNHHISHKMITQAALASKGITLESELKQYKQDLATMLGVAKRVIVVKSNHDEWVDQYLQECKYKDEPSNHRIALELALAKLDGNDPLEYYVRSNGLTSERICFLKRDESYKIAGIECGMHGDKGANGGNPSAKSMEESYGDCVYGHTHTPNILRGSWCVGTSTPLQVGYNVGASSWFNTSCLVYANGTRQLINCIDGRWCTKRI